MKKTIFICIFLFPLATFARFGWSFTNYTLLAGQQYKIQQKALWGFDLQYDKFKKSCLKQVKYCGIGFNYSFNNSYKEYGTKAMWSPIFITVFTSRSTKFYPYLFGQGNYVVQTIKSENLDQTFKKNTYVFKPGLGITGNINDDEILSIRTYLQCGYNINNDRSLNFKDGLSIELKIGIGFNKTAYKRNKLQETNSNL